MRAAADPHIDDLAAAAADSHLNRPHERFDPPPYTPRPDCLVPGDIVGRCRPRLHLAPAVAQPIGSMPSTTKELWQWFRTQPVLDLQRTYLDVARRRPDAAGRDGDGISRP